MSRINPSEAPEKRELVSFVVDFSVNSISGCVKMFEAQTLAHHSGVSLVNRNSTVKQLNAVCEIVRNMGFSFKAPYLQIDNIILRNKALQRKVIKDSVARDLQPDFEVFRLNDCNYGTLRELVIPLLERSADESFIVKFNAQERGHDVFGNFVLSREELMRSVSDETFYNFKVSVESLEGKSDVKIESLLGGKIDMVIEVFSNNLSSENEFRTIRSACVFDPETGEFNTNPLFIYYHSSPDSHGSYVNGSIVSFFDGIKACYKDGLASDISVLSEEYMLEAEASIKKKTFAKFSELAQVLYVAIAESYIVQEVDPDYIVPIHYSQIVRKFIGQVVDSCDDELADMIGVEFFDEGKEEAATSSGVLDKEADKVLAKNMMEKYVKTLLAYLQGKDLDIDVELFPNETEFFDIKELLISLIMERSGGDKEKSDRLLLMPMTCEVLCSNFSSPRALRAASAGAFVSVESREGAHCSV